MANIAQNLAEIGRRISTAASHSGRDPGSVKLVAVSKTHPASAVNAAIEAGAVAFGENKVQEGVDKIAEVGKERAEWHLIGHLQSNKARKAVQAFDVIQTLDSAELAERLDRICIEEGRAQLDILIQVDLGGEVTKSGVPENELPAVIDAVRSCERLRLRGLMTLPPFFDDAEQARPYFRRLRELCDDHIPDGELSMGMSHDFEVAIEEGATIVRVGTAIFGAR